MWEDEKMWEDVRRCEKMRRRWEDEKMWRWEDVKMRRCEDVKMRRCEDERMWRWEDVKMRRCEDERMWRWEDVKMRGCEDERMWRWEDVKMRRCFTGPHYWKNPALRRSRKNATPKKKTFGNEVRMPKSPVYTQQKHQKLGPNLDLTQRNLALRTQRRILTVWPSCALAVVLSSVYHSGRFLLIESTCRKLIKLEKTMQDHQSTNWASDSPCLTSWAFIEKR